MKLNISVDIDDNDGLKDYTVSSTYLDSTYKTIGTGNEIELNSLINDIETACMKHKLKLKRFNAELYG